MEATAIIDFDRKNRIFTATSKELSPYEVEGEGETVYEAVEEFIFHIQDDIEYYEMYGQVNGLPDTRNLYNFLKSASNLNDNLNCSKELEHYAS